jgi:hypothetical protein
MIATKWEKDDHTSHLAINIAGAGSAGLTKPELSIS